MTLPDDVAIYFTDGGAARRTVLQGTAVLGVCSGVLGTFALLRRQSLLGDAMAHAALPGICLAFLLTGTKHPLALLAGALVTGLLGAGAVLVIRRHSRVKEDAAIGLVLSVFFGIGIVLLTVIQHGGSGEQTGLDSFLFGKAAALLPRDVAVMAVLCAVSVSLVALFYKEFQLLTFDPAYCASLGFPARRLNVLLTALVVLAVMVGLQAVGVVLMVAMLIFPAAAARQWTHHLGWMLVLAAAFGALSGAAGSIASGQAEVPLGPAMVLAAAGLLIGSVLTAPGHGVITTFLRRLRTRRRIREENLLKALYVAGETEGRWERPVSALGSAADDAGWLRGLARAGAVVAVGRAWRLTEPGLRRARAVVRRHRLWELYLTRQADIAADHVHRDADEVEHVLTPDVIRQLEALLETPGTDPHGKPIPPA